MSFWKYLQTATKMSLTTTLGTWLLSFAGVLGLGSLVGLGQVVLFKASALPPAAWTGLFIVAIVLAALTVLHAAWKLMTATEQRAENLERELRDRISAAPSARILLNRQNVDGATTIEDFGNLEMNDGVIRGPFTIRGGSGTVTRDMKFGAPLPPQTHSETPQTTE